MAAVTLAALNVYPVKGCRGIAVSAAEAAETGVAVDGVSDREWMIADPSGRFLTQRERPRMALIAPALHADAIVLTAPAQTSLTVPLRPLQPGPARDAVVWRSQVRARDEGDAAAAWLSNWLDTPARLLRFDRSHRRACNPDYVGESGAHTYFADGYPVLVIGSASLDDLNSRLEATGAAALPMNRFRPNVVVDGLGAYDEDHLDTLTFGNVTLRLVKPCIRCQVTTTDQTTAVVGREPLATLAGYRRDDRLAGVAFGMNAIVAAGVGTTLRTGMSGAVEFRF